MEKILETIISTSINNDYFNKIYYFINGTS